MGELDRLSKEKGEKNKIGETKICKLFLRNTYIFRKTQEMSKAKLKFSLNVG